MTKTYDQHLITVDDEIRRTDILVSGVSSSKSISLGSTLGVCNTNFVLQY
jgi:hypothetical protein